MNKFSDPKQFVLEGPVLREEMRNRNQGCGTVRTASAGEVAAAAVALAVDAAVAGVVPRGASIEEMGAGTGTPGGAGAIGVASVGVERTA